MSTTMHILPNIPLLEYTYTPPGLENDQEGYFKEAKVYMYVYNFHFDSRTLSGPWKSDVPDGLSLVKYVVKLTITDYGYSAS